MQAYLVSVVIPVLNEAASLQQTVASIGDHADTEILVVDGGSTDGTIELARSSGCTVLHAPRGRGTQLATGARAARGRWLWFVHADTRVPASWRQILLDAQHPAACLRLQLEGTHPGLRLIELGAWVRTAWDSIPYGDQTLWIARSLYLSAGGYDAVPLFEDVLLARRLRDMGSPVARLPAAACSCARRWHHDGLWQRTVRNWHLRWLFERGTDPRDLATRY